MRYRLEGVVVLPNGLLVAPDALGQTFHGHTGLGAFEIIVPALPTPAPTNSHTLIPPPSVHPDLASVIEQAYDWGYGGFHKHRDHPRSLASWVRTVAIHAEPESADDKSEPDLATEFGDNFQPWYEHFSLWIEAWTPLNLSRHNDLRRQTRGHALVAKKDAPVLTGWGAHAGSVSFARSDDAATIQTLQAAARYASEAGPPPMPWRLLSRATRETDLRLAVIDAGTAAEMALAIAAHDRLASVSQKAPRADHQERKGVTGMVTLLELIDGATQTRRQRVIHHLAEPRNDAAHRGRTPSKEEADRAMVEARSILESYAPCPQP